MTENNEEIQLTDGQTENLPETPATASNDQLNGLQPGCGEMTTSPDDRYYTQGEFEAAFNEFLEFLKSRKRALTRLRACGRKARAWRLVKSTVWRKNTAFCAG